MGRRLVAGSAARPEWCPSDRERRSTGLRRAASAWEPGGCNSGGAKCKTLELLTHSRARHAEPASGLGLVPLRQLDSLCEQAPVHFVDHRSASILEIAMLGSIEQV